MSNMKKKTIKLNICARSQVQLWRNDSKSHSNEMTITLGKVLMGCATQFHFTTWIEWWIYATNNTFWCNNIHTEKKENNKMSMKSWAHKTDTICIVGCDVYIEFSSSIVLCSVFICIKLNQEHAICLSALNSMLYILQFTNNICMSGQ